MTMPVTRRQLVLSAAAAAGAAGAGGAWAAGRSAERFVAALLRRDMDGVPLASGAPRAFAADFVAGLSPSHRRRVEVMAAASRFVGVDGVVALLETSRAFETFRRRSLTRFAVSSTLFTRDRNAAPVEYSGGDLNRACAGNPFAQFD